MNKLNALLELDFHNHAITLWATVIAVGVTALLVTRVTRVARRNNGFKMSSLMLAALPLLIITGGAGIDTHRTNQHVQVLAASDSAEATWSAIEEELRSKYQIASVKPTSDAEALVQKLVVSQLTENNFLSPRVFVQIAPGQATTTYVLRSVDGALELHLQRHDSESLDPEQLLASNNVG